MVQFNFFIVTYVLILISAIMVNQLFENSDHLWLGRCAVNSFNSLLVIYSICAYEYKQMKADKVGYLKDPWNVNDILF